MKFLNIPGEGPVPVGSARRPWLAEEEMKPARKGAAEYDEAVAQVCLSCTRASCNGGYYGCPEYKAAVRAVQDERRARREAVRVGAASWMNKTIVTMEGESRSVAEWCRVKGLSQDTVRTRIKIYGWSPERAVSEPCNGRGRRSKVEAVRGEDGKVILLPGTVDEVAPKGGVVDEAEAKVSAAAGSELPPSARSADTSLGEGGLGGRPHPSRPAAAAPREGASLRATSGEQFERSEICRRVAAAGPCAPTEPNSPKGKAEVAAASAVGSSADSSLEDWGLRACPMCGRPVQSAVKAAMADGLGECIEVDIWCAPCGVKLERFIRLEYGIPLARLAGELRAARDGWNRRDG